MTRLDKENLKEKKPKVKAAIYVRMSTEHQQYSAENQADAISKYAQQHDIEIVKTYADEGKSGLKIDGREALKRLLSEVQSGVVDFQAILVYDISRWGRFQDADESAYYEYICRRAGMSVSYCAEQFENDGSPTSTIIKSVKRAMAGEYSRELSIKVFQGQCRLIQLGYRQGGTAGYGLRRMLVDQEGKPKGELSFGEHKSIQTDRVMLVLGPQTEIKTVRRIYRLFVKEKKSESEIADILNERGTLTDMGRRWNAGTIRQILSNEKYIGNNVYNRQSYKLKMKRVRNPPEMWIRADGAFEGIVNIKLFSESQALLAERQKKVSDEELLENLKRLYEEHGWLSAIIIDEKDRGPSSSVYRHRFGSLVRAYHLVGYTPKHDYRYLEINRRLRKMYPDILENVLSEIRKVGATVEHNKDTGLALLNGEITLCLVISRCFKTPGGNYRWKIRLDHAGRPDITIVMRMDGGNKDILDYYLLPALDMTHGNLRTAECNGLWIDAYRFDNLDYLFEMARRKNIEEIA